MVGQRSYLALFAGEAASGWGLWPLLGTGQYLGVHGCSHCGRWSALPVLICHPLFRNCQTTHSSSNLLLFLSSELETILPINCCMTILLLNDLQNWRSFVEKNRRTLPRGQPFQ